MKINSNHPLAKHGLIVDEQVNHNGINYTVENESFGRYELEPDLLLCWKGRTVYSCTSDLLRGFLLERMKWN